MYASGAQGYMDYVGMHPYNQPNPPNFGILDTLQSIMANNGDSNKQIMVTEVGWPTSTSSSGVTEANQAAYIGQVYQGIMHGNYDYVALACVYDFLDDGTDKTNDEDNFGLLRTDYSQKPAYSTMQTERNDYNANFTPINP
jgi:exo-beta-1,3-glucanase (GH17 family)